MVRSIRLLSLLAAFGALVLAPAAANAEISRHCQGALKVELRKGVDKDGKAYDPKGKSGDAVIFKGRGNCKNKRNANDCRKRAMMNISACAGNLWNQRHSRKVPPQCAIAKNTSREYGGIESWGAPNTPAVARAKMTGDVKRAVEYVACCQLTSTVRELEFRVAMLTTGDKFCAHRWNLEDRYKANCKKLREEGLCNSGV